MIIQIFALFGKMKSLSQTIIRSGFILSILPLVLLVLAGTAVYAWLEGWSLIDALYATVITVTTIGYGDLAPQTSAGRLFSVFFTILYAVYLSPY